MPFPSRPIRELLGLEDQTVRELLALIQRARQNLLVRLSLANPESHTPDVLRQILSSVDDVTANLARDLTLSFQPRVLGAIDLGADIVQMGLPGTARTGVGFIFPPELLRAINDFNAFKVVQISEELRGAINTQVQLGWLSGQSVPQVAQRIGATSLKPIGPFKTVEDRAKAIARTELNRVANIAAGERLEKATEIIPAMEKEWWSAEDWRVRPAHRAAHGQVVPVSGKFVLFDSKGKKWLARYPHDPILPAELVVKCRCRVLPKVPENYDAEPEQVVPVPGG